MIPSSRNYLVVRLVFVGWEVTQSDWDRAARVWAVRLRGWWLRVFEVLGATHASERGRIESVAPPSLLGQAVHVLRQTPRPTPPALPPLRPPPRRPRVWFEYIHPTRADYPNRPAQIESDAPIGGRHFRARRHTAPSILIGRNAPLRGSDSLS